MNNRTGNFLIEILFKTAGIEKPSNEQLTIANNAIKCLLNEFAAIREQEIALYHKFMQQNPKAETIATEKIGLDIKNEYGETLLTYSAKYGHPQFIQFLVEAKVDPNTHVGNYNTALTSAISNNRIDNVKTLLTLKANPDKANPQGESPLTLACQANDDEKSIEIIKTLLEYKANLNMPNLKDATTPLTGAIYKGNTNILKVLLANNVNPNQSETTTGKDPLTYASLINNAVMTQLLLEAKAHPNALNRHTGDTAFTEAAQLGHTDVMQVLMAAKVDIHAPHSKTGDSPLIHIFRNRKVNRYGWDTYNSTYPNCLKSARVLLDAKADPNFVNLKNGDTPLLQAANLGHSDVVQMLLEAKADTSLCNNMGKTPLIEAITNNQNINDINSIKLILDAKANPNKPGPETTPLIEATKKGVPIVQILLNAKAFLNMANEISGDTPLITAVKCKNIDVTQALLDANADVDRHNIFNGQTALMMAVNSDQPNIALTLLQNRANPNKRNHKTDETALTIAAYYGYKNCVKHLIDAQADLEITEKERTSLDFAVDNSKFSVISLLLDHKAILHEPNKLYTSLSIHNLCDFVNLNLFIQLYQQQVSIRKNNQVDPKLKLDSKQFQQLEDDYQKINKAITVTTVNDTLLDKATGGVLPSPLKNMIRSYDFPLERMGFFETRVTPKEIEIYLKSKNPLTSLESKLAGLQEEIRQKKKLNSTSNDLFSTSQETLWNEIIDLNTEINRLKEHYKP